MLKTKVNYGLQLQIVGYMIISYPLNDHLLQENDFRNLKDPALDNFMLDKMIESIFLYK